MGAPDELDSFYEKIGTLCAVDTLFSAYEGIFTFIHEAGYTPDYRAARGRLKRLRDEVTPIVGLLRRQAGPKDFVKFNLDSSDHDAIWICTDRPRKIDATVAQARARLNLMEELNTRGQGRGFLPLVDDDRTERFLAAMEQEPSCYSTEEYISTLDRAIRLCLQKKQRSVADVLVIDAPVSKEYIPTERLGQIPIIRESYPSIGRKAVYIVNREICIRIGQQQTPQDARQ